ncbi:MAG: DUF2683 family protein [Candidatus Woesearchaeota archaeon]
MVQATISLEERNDRILSIIKGKYGLKNKSDAINFAIAQFEEQLEPSIRPEYVEKIKKLEQEKPIRFHSMKEFDKLIEG